MTQTWTDLPHKQEWRFEGRNLSSGSRLLQNWTKNFHTFTISYRGWIEPSDLGFNFSIQRLRRSDIQPVLFCPCCVSWPNRFRPLSHEREDGCTEMLSEMSSKNSTEGPLNYFILYCIWGSLSLWGRLRHWLGHAPLWAVTEQWWGGPASSQTAAAVSRQRAAAAARGTDDTTVIPLPVDTYTSDTHTYGEHGGPRTTGAESPAGRAGGAVRWHGSCHEVGE